MTREEAIQTLKANYPDKCYELLRNAVDIAIEALKAEPYIEFCEWVADTVLYEDFEDKWTLGAFAEVACRKLHKLGFVRKDGDYWTAEPIKHGSGQRTNTAYRIVRSVER